MPTVQYQEITCKSALNRVRGMPFRWSLNPYRGCVHGCHYCYARSTHHYFDLDAGEDFTSILFIKTNVAERLRSEVNRPSWRRETIGIGTATDPYQPAEGRFRLTRRCLEVLAERGTPFNIVTKSPLVVRDVDILRRAASRADVRVFFSITTLDAVRARRLEPGTAPPHQRLRGLRRLRDAGVPAGVLIAPIVPGLTSSPDELEQVVRAAAEHGACWIGAKVMRLDPAVKQWFLAFVQREYPALRLKLERLYSGMVAPSDYTDRVYALVDDLKARYGASDQPSTVPGNRDSFQLSFDLESVPSAAAVPSGTISRFSARS